MANRIGKLLSPKLLLPRSPKDRPELMDASSARLSKRSVGRQGKRKKRKRRRKEKNKYQK